MLNKGSEKMTIIEAFLYEKHLKERDDSFCRKCIKKSEKNTKEDSDFEIISSYSEKIVEK